MKAELNWIGGNRVHLLENGEAHYAAVYKAIEGARHEILVETFILFDDRVGRELQRHLIAAAERGVAVDLTVDGFGSHELPQAFVAELTSVGARVHVYEPTPIVRQLKPRRMHRKIVVVDGAVAFVGGINFSEDHLASAGPRAKQDYAVRIEGPAVATIHRFATRVLAPVHRRLGLRPSTAARGAHERAPADPVGDVEVAFVTRDNRRHRTDIERVYRMAIRTATRSVLIANAYFFPGYGLLRDLRRAASRGVSVQLVLQRQPDVPIARLGGRLLYDGLLKDGVAIYEYCRREMHGKVAAVDDTVSTIGSSNLDPLSLAMSLEANVLVRDRAFCAALTRRLQHLMEHDCERLDRDAPPRRTMWRYVAGALAYHLVRGFPRWLRLPYSGARIRSYAGDRTIETRAAFDGS